MKQGKSISQLYKELERQRSVRKDVIADTRSLRVVTEDGRSRLDISSGREQESFVLSDVAHRQIADRLGIPFKYYEKMQSSYPTLLDQNVNGWLLKNPERRMLRILDGRVRAFLSDRYRRLDNLELADAILPVIAEMPGADILSAEVTETRMFIKVVNKTLRAEISTGDVVQAGFMVSNSEVGLGSLKVEPLIYRLVCRNGLIVKDYAQKRYHVGKQINTLEEASELFSDDTMLADDKAFFMKVQDVVKAAVNEAKFSLCIDKLKSAKNVFTDQPIQTVEVLGEKYALPKNERAAIMRHFLMSGDYSQYGLINSVTRASQDLEDYSRATELERLGGELLSQVNVEDVAVQPEVLPANLLSVGA